MLCATVQGVTGCFHVGHHCLTFNNLKNGTLTEMVYSTVDCISFQNVKEKKNP